MDGADAIIQDVEVKTNEKEIEIVEIKVKILNDWISGLK